jgi:Domain of unknown function (DUF5666)
MKSTSTGFEAWIVQRLQCVCLALLLLVAAGMTACGGGASQVAAMPGTGGTGITAQGPITGFGSVIVNGIRFDDTAASVQMDGAAQTASQLRLGMVASVAGIKSTATVTATASVSALGVARSVEVWSIAQGRVSGFAQTNTFSVAGMTMAADVGTVFEGAMSVSGLSTDSFVKVWGQPITTDFTQWAVTRVEVLGSSVDTVSTGLLHLAGANASLNGLALLPASATAALADGQLVRAVGALAASSAGGTLTLGKLTALGATGTTATAVTGHVKLQGVVTSVLASSATVSASVTRLTLGATEVDLSHAAVTPAGARIASGQHLVVYGSWNGAVLVANKVQVQTTQQLQEVEIKGVIEQFTSVANFTVRGQRCDASGLAKVDAVRLSRLPTVSLHGRKDGDVVRVTELEFE